MKVKLFIGLWLFLLSSNGYAADPFNRHSKVEVSEKIQSTCGFGDESVVASHLSVKALKVVGIVLYGDQGQAYFSDEKGQLFAVKQGERFAQEGYLLKQLQKNQLSLADARCSDNPQQIIRF